MRVTITDYRLSDNTQENKAELPAVGRAGSPSSAESIPYSLNSHQAFVWIRFFKESYYIAQASLELADLLTQPL